MNQRRTMILIGAIAVGVLAAFALWKYTANLEDDVYADAERVPVFVALRDIPAGTPGEQAREVFIEQRAVPREFVPASVVANLDEIVGKVAANGIPANSFIISGQFVNQAEAQTTFTQRIPDGLVAVTLPFGQQQAVAGLLVPGDTVMLMAQTDLGTVDPATGESTTESNYLNNTRVFYQEAIILALGSRTTTAPGEEAADAGAVADTGLVTFAVPPEAALRLASIDPGKLYMALTPDTYVPYEIPPITAQELTDLSLDFPGENGTILTPYGPEGYVEGDEATEDPADVAFTDEADADTTTTTVGEGN